MEYEIEDEGGLFDQSNNPSLDPASRREGSERPRAARNASPEDARRRQKGEAIPDEAEAA